jgi:hypothetical protein
MGGRIMFGLDNLEALYVIWAVLFQAILIVHFAVRKWAFRYTVQYGWIVYALSIPAVVVSLVLLLGEAAWYLWVGGFIFVAWAIYGYWVDYVKRIQWRTPIRWQTGGPYLLLYLATLMFYWWPLGRISRPLWYVGAVLFVLSTVLNITSHKPESPRLGDDVSPI